MNKIDALEQRYQSLYNDYQAGRLDETAFVAEVDSLQFQDEWGRYWMIGSQTGSWHYYDGQTWHQADPHDADKLPFMDDQGRYWQRGAKSGDWYYYQEDQGEWVKPGRDEGVTPPRPAQNKPKTRRTAVTQKPQTRLQSAAAGPQAPTPSDGGELFQDDEGRYWSQGAKTGQWYFFDNEGWHPAHEFQTRVAAQQVPVAQPAYQAAAPQMPYQPSYGQQAPAYTPPAYQPPPGQYGYAPQQPASPNYPGPGSQPPSGYPQGYAPQPSQSPPLTVDQRPGPAPAQPGAEPQPTDNRPEPPTSKRTKSGAWYYLDGDRWYRYSDDEQAKDAPPPDPDKIIEPPPAPSRKAAKQEEVKVEPDEPVVAELFEEDEPAPEVVDVEIVTVIEAEPEWEPEAYEMPAPAPPPERPQRPSTASAPVARRSEEVPRREEEIRPRRATRQNRPVESQPASRTDDIERPPRRQRTSTEAAPREPSRPVAPRKKEEAHEPTIIIPTDSAASPLSSANKPPSRPVQPVSRPAKPDSRPVKPVSRPVQPVSRPVVTPEQQRRARENTLPIEPAKPAGAPTPLGATPLGATPLGQQAHRTVTQSMPQVVRSGPERTGANPRAVTAPLDVVKPKTAPASPTPSSRPATIEPEKEGFTLGDILRSLPGTIWTFAAGMVVLVVVAVILLILGLSFFGGDQTGSTLAANEATPTLSAAAPNATPTSGPTSTAEAEPIEAPEPADLTVFTSEALAITLDYPENWETEDSSSMAIFSPSEDGLDIDNLQDAAFWISKSDDEASVSELLTAILAEFPGSAETLNQGTINIASQPWTSAQIRFDNEDLGGQGIATLAVTNKDGIGYSLVAVSPAETWNLMQPTYQEMINSFRFGVAQTSVASSTGSTTTADKDEDETTTATTDEEAEDKDAPSSSSSSSRSTPTPTPAADATPVVHVIESGDTLLGIANQYGVDVDLLTTENGITNPNSLSLGQELVIPFTAEELADYNRRNGITSPGSSSSSAADADEADEDSTAAGTDETDEEDAPGSGSASSNSSSSSSSTGNAASDAASLGGRIAYPAFNPGTNVYDLWIFDIASGEQNIIAAEASQPAFNRDGSLLAYRSWNRGSRGIFFRDFVGGRGGQVTRFVEDGLPTWSPDGYSFAFASRREGDRVARLFRGNQEGFEDVAIGFNGEYPTAFPDGKLVVKGCSITGDCGLYIMGANGGGEKKISGEFSDSAPAVSPDGSKIAFMSSARGATNWEIWVMNADGSNPQRLTDNGSNEGLPAWSPDGKSIAYVTDQGGLWAIWAMNADGSNQRKLVNMSGSPDGIVLHDNDNSRGWLEERISWAP